MGNYIYKIYEQSYEDEWENGEIEKTFSSIEVHKSTPFNTLKEAVKNALETWGKLGQIEDISEERYVLCLSSELKAVHNNYLQDPTPEEMKAWKAGKINLLSVEHIAYFEYIENVEYDNVSDDITEMVNDYNKGMKDEDLVNYTECPLTKQTVY